MKIPLWPFAILAAAVLAVPGCGKQKEPTSVTTQSGVTVDMPKLQQAFSTASPELRTSVTQVAFSFRYGQYADALAQLEKIAARPDLTEPQKQVVNEVIDQVKKAAAKGPTS
jgi:nitrogen regulatory protein PII